MVRVLIPTLNGFPGLGINGRQVVLVDGIGEFENAELDILRERFRDVTVLDVGTTSATDTPDGNAAIAGSAESEPAKRRDKQK